MSHQVQDLARWKTISQGQCAFRSSNSQTNKLRCKHLFTNTSECHFIGCPIVQTKYVAIQRSYDVIYLVTKDSEAKIISDTWKDQELPVDKDAALNVVNDSVSNLNNVLKSAVKSKFEHLHSVSSTIRESAADSDTVDSDTEDSDTEDSDTESDSEDLDLDE